MLETVTIIYIVYYLPNCPCALRTCGLKHYTIPEKLGAEQTVDWEASNLDCGFVENYTHNIQVAMTEDEKIQSLQNQMIEQGW